MDACSRVFPFDKSIMLNALYDTLDTLGFQIEMADSQRGTVSALSSGAPARRIRIACSSALPEGKTAIQITPEIEDDTGGRLAAVLMDEITATAKGAWSPTRAWEDQEQA